jgi:ATP-binding cassette subfamily B protein
VTATERGFILDLWRRAVPALALVVALTAIATAFKVSVPLVLKTTFDGLAASLSGAQSPEAASHLAGAVLLFLVLASADWLLQAGLMMLRAMTNYRFEWLARARAFGSLLGHGRGFYRRFRTGDLVTRLIDDAGEKMSWFACSGVFRALSAALVVLFALVMMLRLDPWLTLVTAGPLPLLVLVHVVTGNLIDRRYRDVQARISDLNAAVEACFSGIRVVKAYSRESAEERNFAALAEECRRSEVAAVRSQTVMDSLYGNIWQLGVIAVFLAGGIAVMRGRISLGTFVAFEAYVLMMVFPMLDLGTFLVRMRQSSVSIGRLLEIDAPRRAAASAERSPHVEAPRGHLRFEGVTVRHDEGSKASALADVSLDVEPGKLVALAGRVGGGKSTLLALACRLAEPASGRVLLDGVDVRDIPLHDLRRAVAYAPQEAVLFSGTIRENIRFGREHLSDADVQWAAEVARLAPELAAFTAGMETRVGVRGLSLSGGQAQRVALARALAGRPRVLLLDDVTSALDAETESQLWRALRSELPHLATLAATHRTATLRMADTIVVLEAGHVVEHGSHAELRRTGRHYRAVYERSAAEELVGGVPA